jgi:hypothetical protein
MFRQARSELQRRGTPRKILEQEIQLALKCDIVARFIVRTFELLERSDERLRHVAAPVGSEAAPSIRPGLCRSSHVYISRALSHATN